MSLSPMQTKELLDASLHHSCDGAGRDQVCVKIAAIGELLSRFGDFQVVAFYNNRDRGGALACRVVWGTR